MEVTEYRAPGTIEEAVEMHLRAKGSHLIVRDHEMAQGLAAHPTNIEAAWAQAKELADERMEAIRNLNAARHRHRWDPIDVPDQGWPNRTYQVYVCECGAVPGPVDTGPTMPKKVPSYDDWEM